MRRVLVTATLLATLGWAGNPRAGAELRIAVDRVDEVARPAGPVARRLATPIAGAPGYGDALGQALPDVEWVDPWVAAPGSAEWPADRPDLRALTVSPVEHVQSSGYGWRDDPVDRRHRKFHKGTDFRADRGTPVLAAAGGWVRFAGVKGGYGKVVFLDHGGGVTTRYAHLSSLDVAEGDIVGAGALIARVGATGRVTGPHLHFEVRLDGRAVDPVLAMRIAEAQRLAPDIAAGLEPRLAPEVQAQALDASDDTNRRRARSTRPERPGRAPRERNLM